MTPEAMPTAAATQLREDLLEELMSHSPAAVMRVLRRRPGGAISLVHLNVLSVLEYEGPQPMRALAEALDVSSASATGIVDRMEERGLVVRLRDTQDRRVIRVALTEEGRSILGGLTAERREALGELLAELSDDEVAGFLLGVRAMRRARERRAAEGACRVPPAPAGRPDDPVAGAAPRRGRRA
jgi:DNA-binding MarR family transcriptional regulator